MTVGEKIKQRRIELNMSQDELAKKCGYKSRSSINKIELSRDLPLKKVKRMAVALDLSVAYLMGWEDEIETPISEDVIKGVNEIYDNPVMQELVEKLYVLGEFYQKQVLDVVNHYVSMKNHNENDDK